MKREPDSLFQTGDPTIHSNESKHIPAIEVAHLREPADPAWILLRGRLAYLALGRSKLDTYVRTCMSGARRLSGTGARTLGPDSLPAPIGQCYPITLNEV
jgi:hypothetical protein